MGKANVYEVGINSGALQGMFNCHSPIHNYVSFRIERPFLCCSLRLHAVQRAAFLSLKAISFLCLPQAGQWFGSEVLPANVWSHISLGVDGTDQRHFVNGNPSHGHAIQLIPSPACQQFVRSTAVPEGGGV